MSKKLVPVDIVGATVWLVSHERIALLAEDSLIYVISFADQPEFKKFDLEEGSAVWAYFITVNRKVTGIIPYEASHVREQLPQGLPVEIEVTSAKQARY